MNQNVQNDEIRLKNMERNSKSNHLSEEFYKMIDNFKKIFERLENTSNKKFRKVAEDELKEIYKIILNVQLDTSNNVFGMFDKTIDEEIWRIIRYKYPNWYVINNKCEKKFDKGNISGSPYDKILTDKNIQM